MKQKTKSPKKTTALPLIWRDCSWTVSIKITPESGGHAFPSRFKPRGGVSFLPFRGFNFCHYTVPRI